MKFEKLYTEYELTEPEKEFIVSSNTAITADMNQTRVIADIILAKTLKKSSESGDKHARALNWLTAALVFVGLVQIYLNWK